MSVELLRSVRVESPLRSTHASIPLSVSPYSSARAHEGPNVPTRFVIVNKQEIAGGCRKAGGDGPATDAASLAREPCCTVSSVGTLVVKSQLHFLKKQIFCEGVRVAACFVARLILRCTCSGMEKTTRNGNLGH